ncbi:hypothetical protein NFI96_006047 [Prochilodus magdalenae]|nr:hypothetical protein NFI96_006047 [Prochilodus magdalenae]
MTLDQGGLKMFPGLIFTTYSSSSFFLFLSLIAQRSVQGFGIIPSSSNTHHNITRTAILQKSAEACRNLVLQQGGNFIQTYKTPLADGCTTQDFIHKDRYHVTVTKDCSGVVPDCHGATQNGSGSSSVTSPALVLVETPNESVCGGTVVSTKMNSLPSHVQKTWCPSASTPTAPSAGTV